MNDSSTQEPPYTQGPEPEPEFVNNSDRIPFPGAEDIQSSSVAKSPTDSQETSSSKQTSSDKLTALPTSKSTPNTNRFRSPVLGSSSNFLPNRLFRRSLDASVSLPSFSHADLDPSLGWKTNNTHGMRSPEHSPEKDTPRQRVSFDSDRGSLPTIQSVRQALSRMSRGSDPVITSPAQRSSAYRGMQKEADSLTPGSRSPSHSRSRAASPLRLFQQWSSGLHRPRQQNDDPFVPINPYTFKAHFQFPCFPGASTAPTSHIHTHSVSSDTPGCEACIPPSAIVEPWTNIRIFLGDTLPREVYLNLLLRLPSMYFSRVARIFEDAEVSKPDIQRMIESGRGSSPFFGPASEQVTIGTADSMPRVEYPPSPVPATPTMAAGIGLAAHIGAASASVPQLPLPFPDEWTPPLVSHALIRFKNSWELFIDTLIREWKTLNVVSALLLSAILTMFQIPSAADDPVTRTVAFLSLICALMSLSYGCMYIVRFGTMRSMLRAAKWAEEARKTKTLLWWNVWVLLAMPAVWMSWSMVLFVASILSFVWRTGSVDDPDDRLPLSSRAALGARLAVTGVFILGMIYFVLIVRTLQSYGLYASGKAQRRRDRTRAEPTLRLPLGRAEATIERRGRERQRGASGSRRRQTTPDLERGRGVGALKGGKKPNKGGLKTMLGLGFTGIGVGVGEPAVHVDLEDKETIV